MFLEMQSGDNICLAHVVRVINNKGTKKSVTLTLSDGSKVSLAGIDADYIKKEVADCFTLAANNTLAYMQFEKYSQKIMESLAVCETLMTKAGKASAITTQVMRTINEVAITIDASVDELKTPTNNLKRQVTRLKDIISD